MGPIAKASGLQEAQSMLQFYKSLFAPFLSLEFWIVVNDGTVCSLIMCMASHLSPETSLVVKKCRLSTY